MKTREQFKFTTGYLLSKVLSESLSNLHSTMYGMTKDRLYRTPDELQARIEVTLPEYKDRIRNCIYNELLSETMKVDGHPFQKIVILGISRLKQVILLMLWLGFSIQEIAQVTLSDKASVMTIRSGLKNDFPEFFQ